MLIGFILTVWILGAAVFVLGLCSAAARSIPQPSMIVTRDDDESSAPLRTGSGNKLQPVLWLAVALAVITSSCAAIPPGTHPINLRGSEPAKGATLLMKH